MVQKSPERMRDDYWNFYMFGDSLKSNIDPNEKLFLLTLIGVVPVNKLFFLFLFTVELA